MIKYILNKIIKYIIVGITLAFLMYYWVLAIIYLFGETIK